VVDCGPAPGAAPTGFLRRPFRPRRFPVYTDRNELFPFPLSNGSIGTTFRNRIRSARAGHPHRRPGLKPPTRPDEETP